MKVWAQEVEKNDDRKKKQERKKKTVSEALETSTACS